MKTEGSDKVPIPPLPHLMVAPNGARLQPADHPALPVTIEGTVATALACQAAGADGLHAHIRDDKGGHLLDAPRYHALLAALHTAGCELFVQVTTEAVGCYRPDEQRAVAEALAPTAISVALREMCAEPDPDAIARFYRGMHARGVSLQHILYSPDDVLRLATLVDAGTIPADDLQCLFVLGGHGPDDSASPSLLDGFLEAREKALGSRVLDWAVCAFGVEETDCLLAAHAAGGKLRVGFENNRLHPDGRRARDNAERVADVADRLRQAMA